MRLLVWLVIIFFTQLGFSQDIDNQGKKLFEKPLLFIAFLVGLFFLSRYLDEKKRKR